MLVDTLPAWVRLTLDAAESAEDCSVPERARLLAKGALFGLGIHDAPLVHLISFAGLPTAASEKSHVARLLPFWSIASILRGRYGDFAGFVLLVVRLTKTLTQLEQRSKPLNGDKRASGRNNTVVSNSLAFVSYRKQKRSPMLRRKRR